MNFARQELEKYGWKDGDGLGRTKGGIAVPIKAKLKFDNAGLGHNLSDEIVNPWWQRVYDSAAEQVQVSVDQGVVKIQAGQTEITTKRKKKKGKINEELGNQGEEQTEEKKKTKKSKMYDNFVMKAALTKEGEKRLGTDDEYEYEDEVEPNKKKKTSGICDLTDEELFKACGGRTAHKGARHGLSMSAKLQRSEQLEQEALQRLRGQISETETKEKKRKKKKKDVEEL